MRAGTRPEPTLAELRALAVEAAAVAPGRWFWSGNCQSATYALTHWRPGWGMTNVMDFARKGMRGAQPRFLRGSYMENADTMARHEVGEANTYRHDIEGFDHPVARWLAAADPTTVLALIDRITDLEGADDGPAE